VYSRSVEEVEVWLERFGRDRRAEREAWEALSAEERERACRLERERDRVLFIRTRGLLRHVLAGHLEVGPREVAIDAGPGGKPRVGGAGGVGWPHFNVSHSGSVALIAVTGRHEVGVDVELVGADIPWREVARACFSPAEITSIERLPPARRRLAFFDCWVRKEAYLKGLGTGVNRPTDDFEVPSGEAGGIVHDASPPPGQRGSTWYVHRLEVGPGYAAALAVDGRLRVTFRRP